MGGSWNCDEPKENKKIFQKPQLSTFNLDATLSRQDNEWQCSAWTTAACKQTERRTVQFLWLSSILCVENSLYFLSLTMLNLVGGKVCRVGDDLQEGSNLQISKELISRLRTLVRPILEFEGSPPPWVGKLFNVFNMWGTDISLKCLQKRGLSDKVSKVCTFFCAHSSVSRSAGFELDQLAQLSNFKMARFRLKNRDLVQLAQLDHRFFGLGPWSTQTHHAGAMMATSGTSIFMASHDLLILLRVFLGFC